MKTVKNCKDDNIVKECIYFFEFFFGDSESGQKKVIFCFLY